MGPEFEKNFGSGSEFAENMPKMACKFMKMMCKNMKNMQGACGQPQNESTNVTKEASAPVSEEKPAQKISGLKSEIKTLKEEAKKCRQEMKEKKREQKKKQKELKQVKKSVQQSKKKYAADVVGHLDLEAESTQAAGTYVLKTWKVKNVGSLPWGEDTIATFKKGHREMVSPDSLNVIVGSVAPGDVTYIRAMFAIPEEAGKYNVTFRLQSPEAGKFGAPLKTTVFVEPTETEESEEKSQVPVYEPSAPAMVEAPEEEEEEEEFEYQHQAEQLVSMGFGLDHIKPVLVATQGNTEQALNLLLNY
jgi:outer membrane biosynthesis protein TonB